jgi:hypothetical protein
MNADIAVDFVMVLFGNRCTTLWWRRALKMFLVWVIYAGENIVQE